MVAQGRWETTSVWLWNERKKRPGDGYRKVFKFIALMATFTYFDCSIVPTSTPVCAVVTISDFVY